VAGQHVRRRRPVRRPPVVGATGNRGQGKPGQNEGRPSGGSTAGQEERGAPVANRRGRAGVNEEGTHVHRLGRNSRGGDYSPQGGTGRAPVRFELKGSQPTRIITASENKPPRQTEKGRESGTQERQLHHRSLQASKKRQYERRSRIQRRPGPIRHGSHDPTHND